MSDKMMPGKVYKTKRYGELEIVEYFNAKKVKVKFIDTGYEKFAQAVHIRSGSVADRMARTVCGVGFLGDGPYKTDINGKSTDAYSAWSLMLLRCYTKVNEAKNKFYDNVSVCEEWQNFQVFADWYYSNKPDHGDNWQIDKDIIKEGNKVYHPDFCRFVTPQENSEKALAKNWRFISPEGEAVEIYNLAKHCRVNSLSREAMGMVHCGKRNHHKGWRAAK